MNWNTPKRIIFLNRLNYLLKEKEQQIVERGIAYLKMGEEKFKSKDPFTVDFMIGVEVAYYCKKKDNPIHTFWQPFNYDRTKNKVDYGLLLDNDDWREGSMPELQKPYCYLLHDLIDHSHLRKKIFDIERIWVDIRITDQLGIKIKDDGQSRLLRLKDHGFV